MILQTHRHTQTQTHTHTNTHTHTHTHTHTRTHPLPPLPHPIHTLIHISSKITIHIFNIFNNFSISLPVVKHVGGDDAPNDGGGHIVLWVGPAHHDGPPDRTDGVLVSVLVLSPLLPPRRLPLRDRLRLGLRHPRICTVWNGSFSLLLPTGKWFCRGYFVWGMWDVFWEWVRCVVGIWWGFLSHGSCLWNYEAMVLVGISSQALVGIFSQACCHGS